MFGTASRSVEDRIDGLAKLRPSGWVAGPGVAYGQTGLEIRRPLRWFLLAMLVLAAVPVAAATASPAADWSSHRSAAGFSVSAPPSWIDTTRLTPQVLAKLKQVPALKSYVSSVRSSLVKLVLADAGPLTVKTGFATNLNVIQAPTAGDVRLLHDATLVQLESSGLVVGTVRATYVQLPAGRAVEFRYQARFGGGTPQVALTQFGFVRNGIGTILTYTTLPSWQAREAPVFQQSARSFRFTS